MSSKKPKKSKNIKKGSKTKNTKPKINPWASFVTTTVHTVIFFWVLFPFYSYQLQTVFDQRQCKGQTPNDSSQGYGKSCLLPHNQHNPPYYPCSNGKLGANAVKGKTCPEEHVKGPDLFHMMLHFARSIFRDGYSILVGEAWIKSDEVAQQVKKDVKKSSVNSNASTQDTYPTTQTKQMKGGNKLPLTGNDIALNLIEDTFGISSRSMKKFQKNSMCCNKFKKYGLSEEEMKTCESPGDSLFNYPPFSWILPTKFGWPYTYIYDDPAAENTTAYNPNGSDEEASFSRYIGAWYAKTQQRSWSSSRSIWSNLLSFFLPYLHEELESDVVSGRIDAFISSLDEKIKQLSTRDPKKTDNIPGSVKVKQLNRLREIKNNFNNIKQSFDKGWKKDNILNAPNSKKRTSQQLLYQVLEGSWTKTKTQNYFNKGMLERQSNPETSNIYLDFFIGATKPVNLRSWHGTSVFWNFLKGDYRYWFRYLTTLYMPIITMLLMFIAICTGLFLTPFSSLNRYSAFFLPLFFGFGTTLFNMIAMPAEAFAYMLFGGSGERNGSSKCPYDGGSYQMKRNMKAYWPINLFLTIAIICTSLGSALVADGKSWGYILTALFPALIILRLVIYGFSFLWALA